jgi:hypothetical protein
MSDQKPKKIIAVGDFLKKRDKVVDFEVLDPDGDGINDLATLPIRIRTATPRGTIKVMEFVNQRLGDKASFTETEMENMSPDERTEAITLAYHYDATLISSCAFYPPAEGKTIEDEPNPIPIFKNSDEVLDRCNSLDLFNQLRTVIGRQRMVITEAEAKK